MSPRARRFLACTVPVAVVTAAIGVVSAAWACVPMANLVSLAPNSSGPPASRVVVKGLGFEQTPVEVRWNAPDGPRLGTARGPNFSVRVTIPKAAKGLYTVVAVERQQDGSIGNAGSAPFEVTARGDETSSGAAAATADGPGAESFPSSQRSWDPPWLTLAAAGFGLVLLGALGAVLITRFRRQGA